MSQDVSTSIASLDLQDALFVFALDMESADKFEQVRKLFTGCGKVNASYELLKAIQHQRPQLIINLGSAGSNHFKRGEVVCCTKFIQRDMDATGLGFQPYETPFSTMKPVLEYGIKLQGLPEGICGTGDNFETNHFTTDYNVIDMEAYALLLLRRKKRFLSSVSNTFPTVPTVLLPKNGQYKFTRLQTLSKSCCFQSVSYRALASKMQPHLKRNSTHYVP